MVVKGSITTFLAIFALGCIYDNGCFIYLTLVIWAINSASAHNLPFA
jgi:hypothetical protein